MRKACQKFTSNPAKIDLVQLPQQVRAQTFRILYKLGVRTSCYRDYISFGRISLGRKRKRVKVDNVVIYFLPDTKIRYLQR